MAKLADNIYMTFNAETVGRLVAGLKKKGKRIVFTNGVFDILHYGHVEYLTRASSLGDVLIVGVNRDVSVKKFKSKNRPIQDEKDRARIVASLRPVDYVIMFKDETPEKLIEMIAPDVLVKGADYKISEIVGAEFVKSYGGEVKRIKLQKGRSSTDIINRIKNS